MTATIACLPSERYRGTSHKPSLVDDVQNIGPCGGYVMTEEECDVAPGRVRGHKSGQMLLVSPVILLPRQRPPRANKVSGRGCCYLRRRVIRQIRQCSHSKLYLSFNSPIYIVTVVTLLKFFILHCCVFFFIWFILLVLP